MMRLLGAGGSPLHRIRTGVEFAASGRHAALACSYERWDGKGWPGKVAGDDAPVASRIVQLAEYVEVAYRTGGTTAAQAIAEGRSGSQFDPTLVRTLSDHATRGRCWRGGRSLTHARRPSGRCRHLHVRGQLPQKRWARGDLNPHILSDTGT